VSAREKWSWELGLIFAALGSAVGLGNIWLFPMLVGENGGAPFLIPNITINPVNTIVITANNADCHAADTMPKNASGSLQNNGSSGAKI